LNGVCKEAVNLLKDYRVTAQAFAVLKRIKRMKPIRQVEAAQVMVASHTHSARFGEAHLARKCGDSKRLDCRPHR